VKADAGRCEGGFVVSEHTDHGLERRRKEAKRLLRDVRAGDETAAARVGAVLGTRAAKRFVLADAQHVVAVEHGFGSWAGLREHGETVIDSGLVYRGAGPVMVRIRKREHRYDIDDDGNAARLSGAPAAPGWLPVAERAVEEEAMNVNRRGVVFVQAVERRDLAKLAGQVARASLAVYDALLDLDEGPRG
jgi:hypothetical protein